jgi:hypothetical protein
MRNKVVKKEMIELMTLAIEREKMLDNKFVMEFNV